MDLSLYAIWSETMRGGGFFFDFGRQGFQTFMHTPIRIAKRRMPTRGDLQLFTEKGFSTEVVRFLGPSNTVAVVRFSGPCIYPCVCSHIFVMWLAS